MLSGNFPQISASDYLGKKKKPDALSPSHQAFPLWPLPFGEANFVSRSSTKSQALLLFLVQWSCHYSIGCKKIKNQPQSCRGFYINPCRNG